MPRVVFFAFSAIALVVGTPPGIETTLLALEADLQDVMSALHARVPRLERRRRMEPPLTLASMQEAAATFLGLVGSGLDLDKQLETLIAWATTYTVDTSVQRVSRFGWRGIFSKLKSGQIATLMELIMKERESAAKKAPRAGSSWAIQNAVFNPPEDDDIDDIDREIAGDEKDKPDKYPEGCVYRYVLTGLLGWSADQSEREGEMDDASKRASQVERADRINGEIDECAAPHNHPM